MTLWNKKQAGVGWSVPLLHMSQVGGCQLRPRGPGRGWKILGALLTHWQPLSTRGLSHLRLVQAFNNMAVDFQRGAVCRTVTLVCLPHMKRAHEHEEEEFGGLSLELSI